MFKWPYSHSAVSVEYSLVRPTHMQTYKVEIIQYKINGTNKKYQVEVGLETVKFRKRRYKSRSKLTFQLFDECFSFYLCTYSSNKRMVETLGGNKFGLFTTV